MLEKRQRIIGYDVARALAVFIMVFVNFNLVLTRVDDEGVLTGILNLLQGKGATLFIVLAGVGISLMIKANVKNDEIKLREKRNVLLKRALFLFVFGLLYISIWPADILHYYGFYISIGALLMTSRSVNLWMIIVLLITVYPFILDFVDYEKGWNWKINEYTDFWTFTGFFRSLFINGFHPVIPWVAFVLAGIWLGKQNMANKNKRNFILRLSLTIFVLVQVGSYKFIEVVVLLTDIQVEDAVAIYGTKPMPPMPLFMISGISWSFIIIIVCIQMTEKVDRKNPLGFLAKTGQLAFTHYILHVVVGILSAYLIFGENNLSTLATFLYALSFCFALVVFSVFWRRKFTKDPVSIFMRSITG
ncbi:DUF418 domain-containing protein [Flavobacterium litorale]|uniref:Heparan-alpha-glucosaminide N-acetyltransferase domain-containing protein n=1 Tax=Flavobacterium litorale TaxID=2856519 RepID=A0ABX8VB28_9FLAO|nr:heparan-alpha-glucosaminide N-acetyltransferase domain-containing protein [Flavobacterium litorale]QYJ68398.1 heparan-alpha-glucosaminide N-acetyltransferase domain-containing protein [Flavobacterium litorale]